MPIASKNKGHGQRPLEVDEVHNPKESPFQCFIKWCICIIYLKEATTNKQNEQQITAVATRNTSKHAWQRGVHAPESSECSWTWTLGLLPRAMREPRKPQFQKSVRQCHTLMVMATNCRWFTVALPAARTKARHEKIPVKRCQKEMKR